MSTEHDGDRWTNEKIYEWHTKYENGTPQKWNGVQQGRANWHWPRDALCADRVYRIVSNPLNYLRMNRFDLMQSPANMKKWKKKARDSCTRLAATECTRSADEFMRITNIRTNKLWPNACESHMGKWSVTEGATGTGRRGARARGTYHAFLLQQFINNLNSPEKNCVWWRLMLCYSFLFGCVAVVRMRATIRMQPASTPSPSDRQ